jgi:hypothetical protein
MMGEMCSEKMFRKKFLLALLLPLLLFGQEEESAPFWDYHPLHMGGNFLRIGKADIDAPQKGNLLFQKANVFLNMLVPVSKKSFFFPKVEWDTFILDWNKNPKFHETHFSYLQFGLMFYTAEIENWRWILRAEYSIDTHHFSHPGTYGLFSGLIWGMHKLNEQWNYHVGSTGYVGMRGSILYPLIGFDYAPTKHWQLRAIFPIDYAIQYKLNEYWSFALKGRPLKERFRAGSQEPQPRSIFNYSSIGAEGNIQYEIERRLIVELYAGYNFGGNFYIKNQGGHKPLYTTVEGAPYGGAKIDYGF